MKRNSIPVIITVVTLLLLLAPVWVKADGTEVTGTVPLVIRGSPNVSNVTASGATISWTTNGASSSKVYYRVGDTGGFFIQTSVSLGPNNSAQLGGLIPSTLYQYYVYSAIDELIADSSLTPDTFMTQSGGGGGGGGGFGGGGGSPGDEEDITDAGTNNINVSIGDLVSSGQLILNSEGVVENTVQLVSPDGTASLSIPAGMTLLDANGKPLSEISPTKTAILAVSPPNGAIVLAYEFGPDGATFSPPLTLTIFYGEAALYSGVSEDSLYIVSWDGMQWVQLATRVNPVAHTILTQISHFSLYVVMGKAIAPILGPTPTTAGTPAPTKKPVETATSAAKPDTTTPIAAATPSPLSVTESVAATPNLTSAPPSISKKQSTSAYTLILIGTFVVTMIAAVLIFLKRRPKL